MFWAELSLSDEVDFSIGDHALFIHEPRSAGCGEARADGFERRLAPVVVVAGNSEQRRFDAGKNIQSLRQKAAFFDQVASEADEIRRQRIDRLYHGARIIAVALVVQVREMYKTMRGFVFRETQAAQFDPGGF